jgi:hypothetical protein
MLIRLTYASRLASGTSEAHIDEIVEYSAASNREQGVTGVLALDGDRIIQVLEGPEWAIEVLFARLMIDTRHMWIVELDRLPIEHHRYQNWGMVRRPMADMLMSVQRD